MSLNPLARVARDLERDLHGLEFGAPVTHVYNPLQYARATYADYVNRYGSPPKEVVLVGMNPGPWGMAQTGIPFGAVPFVRDWMRIRASIGKPPCEHPKRPVLGLDCPRNEVSGTRLWGWARDRFGSPDAFFRRFFVLNYCPLLFLAAEGDRVRNLPANQLRKTESAPLEAACDRHLRRAIEVLRPRYLIGVGAYAENRIRFALGDGTERYTIGRILHPSGANPQAARDWADKAERQLERCGIRLD